MRLGFRQGIARSRAILGTPDFLTYNSTFSTIDVNITTPWLIVSAAFKTKDYLLEERANQSQSWGPFVWNPSWGTTPPVIAYQLFWDVNLATGAVTKGYTPWTPIYGSTPPSSPRIDQHWFSTVDNIMYVWDSTAWKQRCRVFAAVFGPGTLSITHRPFGSQVGINTGGDYLAGYITYGEDLKGIRLIDGTFLTSATDLVVNTGRYSSPVTLEASSTAMIAGEPIPAFACVTNSDLSTCRLANPFNTDGYPIGIAIQAAALGASVEFIAEGVLYNDQWDWDFNLGKDIYCGINGVLYQGDPTLAVNGDLKVGTILSAVSIQVHIDRFGLGGGGGGGMGPLDHDVDVIGTSVGAIDQGYTFLTGTTFSEFVELVSKRTLPPAYTGPTLSISANPSPTNFEIGTVISPILSRTLALNDAGPENAKQLSKNSVVISTTFPYTDNNITLGNTPIVYSSSSSYDEGACKLNNRGVIDCAGRIVAGTVNSNIITFIGTRMVFFGTPGSTPNSSVGVRALGNSSFSSAENSTVDATGVAIGGSVTPNFTITIPIGATRVVFAYPASLRPVASIRYQELADSEVKANFTETTVMVEGANSFTSIAYRVYTYIPVEAFSLINRYRVFI